MPVWVDSVVKILHHPGSLQNQNVANNVAGRVAGKIPKTNTSPEKLRRADANVQRKQKEIVKELLGDRVRPRVLGQGVYGLAVIVRNNEKVIKALRSRLKNVVSSTPLTKKDTHVVIKFIFYQGGSTVKNHFIDCYRELLVHKHLTQSCRTIGCFAKKLCGKNITPPLFFGGADVKTGCFVSVMRPASSQSKTLGQWSGMTPRIYVTLEMLVAGLIANSITHNDLHVNNILISQTRIEIIDWGLSSLIPARIHKCAMKQLLSPEMATKHLFDVWKECGGERWQSQLILHRECDGEPGEHCWGNVDAKLLENIWVQFTPDEKKEAMKLKKEVWSCGKDGGYMLKPSEAKTVKK
jgi:hypothetical protein